MSKYQMAAVTENCTGCLRCQLACSDVFTKRFNPSAAFLRVELRGPDCSIIFTDDCTECGVCADHCFYGALQKTLKEAVQ